jgi:hypothetical protein
LAVIDEKKQKTTPARSRSRWFWLAAPVAAFAVLVVLILGTGKPAPAELMKSAATSFGEVQRGTFRFAITVTPQGSSSAQPSTIELSGPFEMVPGKPLPRARIEYTVAAGGRSQDVTLLTTGDRSYTVIKGQAYELPPSAAKELKAATKDLSKGGQSKGLSGIKLDFDKWLIDPRVTPGPRIDGTATWRTSASVNIVAALKDLAASMGKLSSITGQAAPQLKASQLAEVKKQIRNARVVIDVGRFDHIVRRMELTMLFKTPADAAARTGGISGGSMTLLVGISEPNKPVAIKPPKNPLPYSALQSLANSQSAQSGTALDDGLGR